MRVPQLQKILECGDSGVDALCALTDEFRGSREALELIEALDSESDEIVGLATYILKEIPSSKYNKNAITNRLEALTTHTSSSIRFQALNAVSPFLRSDSARTLDLLERLRGDENEGVRLIANAATKRLGIEN